MHADTEFLPAALEIQEHPPSPAGRAILWAIMMFFCIAVIWTFIGEIDIVATAQGKIVPSGRVKVIQPIEIGVVYAIHVSEGQLVSAGDLLIELDPTSTRADVERLEREGSPGQRSR
jgi:hemolysin D